ncbi:hypothetical protein [Pseudarthrobacter albicanus]|uniref:hypothetical protein n=1 Tax=Pseudarthrobacter albicanus TaxID=2823873 RepID=UPI001BA80D12|nr:hypothetical protein [Pseudarthrobacter albicanus]
MSESTHSDTERSPFTKPGFIISAALVIALLAAVVVIFFLPKTDGTAQPGPVPSHGSASAAPTTSADAAGKSVCGLPSTPDTALGSAPKSTWTLIGKMAAPTDPKTFGPGVTDGDGFRSCFAHSPTGALYAAANIVALGSAKSQPLNAKLTDRLLVHGPGRDIAMKDAATMAPSTGADTTVQIRGFVVKSYISAEADVDLAFETKNGALVHTVLPLRWIDGDWKAKVSDDGQLINDITQLSDLSAFIAWSGV